MSRVRWRSESFDIEILQREYGLHARAMEQVDEDMEVDMEDAEELKNQIRELEEELREIREERDNFSRELDDTRAALREYKDFAEDVRSQAADLARRY